MHRVTHFTGYNAARNPRVLQFVTSATSTLQTITVPAGVIPGDILVLHDRAVNNSGLPATVTPSGWTTPANATFDDANRRKQMVSYKIATAADAGATPAGMNGDSSNDKMLIVVRGDVPVTSLTASFSGNITSGNPTAVAVNVAALQTPLLVIGSYGSNGNIDPRTFSPAEDGEVSGDGSNFIKYKIYNTDPANTSIDMDDEGDANTVIGGYLLAS